MRQPPQAPSGGGRSTRSGRPEGSEHRAACYDSAAELVDDVAGFLAPALDGGGAILIATPEHREGVVAALPSGRTAVRDGRLVLLDAAELLDRLPVADEPDPSAIRDLIADALARAMGGEGPVRVYGEMVALLWERGHVAAAMAVEDAWNQLAATRRFDLLCGYPAVPFTGPDDPRLAALRERHTHLSLTPAQQAVLEADAADPEDAGIAVGWHLPADLTSGARARERLRALLRTAYGGELLDEAELLVTELVNNAVLHARSPVGVTVHLRRDALHVAVSDTGSGVLRRVDTELDDTSGRGLMLVEALSSAWGTSTEGRRKTVWFELRREAA